MKPLSLLIISFAFCFGGFAQTPNAVKEIFYGLPLDTPRIDLITKMNSDKRFTNKQKIDSINSYYVPAFSYWGTINNPYIVKNKPDSSHIEISWGAESKMDTFTKKFVTVDYTLYRTTYYFHSLNEVQQENQTMFERILPYSKDGSNFFTEDDELDIEGEGQTFKLKTGKRISKLDVYVETYKNKHVYALVIEYNREND